MSRGTEWRTSHPLHVQAAIDNVEAVERQNEAEAMQLAERHSRRLNRALRDMGDAKRAAGWVQSRRRPGDPVMLHQYKVEE